MDKLSLLAKEGNPANKGILISAMIILAGIIPNIETNFLKLYVPVDRWLLIFWGTSLLFYFFSMRVNQTEYIDDKGNSWIKTPVYRSSLSKECFNLAIIIFFFFMGRILYLFMKLFIK